MYRNQYQRQELQKNAEIVVKGLENGDMRARAVLDTMIARTRMERRSVIERIVLMSLGGAE